MRWTFMAHTPYPSYLSCALCILLECESARKTSSRSTNAIAWMCASIALSMKFTWCLSCPSDAYSSSFLLRNLLASLRTSASVPVNGKPKRSFRVFKHLTQGWIQQFVWLVSTKINLSNNKINLGDWCWINVNTPAYLPAMFPSPS